MIRAIKLINDEAGIDVNIDMAHVDTNDVDELDPPLKNKHFLRLLNIFQKQYD